MCAGLELVEVIPRRIYAHTSDTTEHFVDYTDASKFPLFLQTVHKSTDGRLATLRVRRLPATRPLDTRDAAAAVDSVVCW